MGRSIILSLNQIRRWEHPQSWMVNEGGHSSKQDVVYLRDTDRSVRLDPGGWSLHAADLLRILWEGPADTECMYAINWNGNTVYRSLWTPRLLETVTESFFVKGDLWVANYRLLRVTKDTAVEP